LIDQRPSSGDKPPPNRDGLFGVVKPRLTLRPRPAFDGLLQAGARQIAVRSGLNMLDATVRRQHRFYRGRAIRRMKPPMETISRRQMSRDLRK
jgi:hypothetical protein